MSTSTNIYFCYLEIFGNKEKDFLACIRVYQGFINYSMKKILYLWSGVVFTRYGNADVTAQYN